MDPKTSFASQISTKEKNGSLNNYWCSSIRISSHTFHEEDKHVTFVQADIKQPKVRCLLFHLNDLGISKQIHGIFGSNSSNLAMSFKQNRFVCTRLENHPYKVSLRPLNGRDNIT